MLNLHVYTDILFVSMRNVPLVYLPRTCTSINVHRNARDHAVIYDWHGP